jgi:hypothetical protein
MTNMRCIRHLISLLILVIISGICDAQKVGYEFRTNGKSYLTISHKIHDNGGLEVRHKTDINENRFTYRHNFKLNKDIVFSVPLHYKREKNEPTFEPRFIYKFDKFKLWVQQEFWFNQLYNLAIATDITYKNYVYRIGWDTSNTIRVRLSIKI